MSGTLIYKRKVVNSKDGYGRLTLPKEVLQYLDVRLGDPVEMLIDPRSNIPSLIIRRAVEEV